MGAPKQKWTAEEEAALRAGVVKHGAGKWRTILKDPEFSAILRLRSNVDLKDKWRNMSVTANGWGSREKARIALKKSRLISKHNDNSKVLNAEIEDSDNEIVDIRHLAMSSESLKFTDPKGSISRLDNLIMEAITDLKEPTGSNKTAIAMYIEEQYWLPPDFKRLLSTKLKALTASGKLIKVKRKYRIPPSLAFSEKRNSKAFLHEEMKLVPLKPERDEIKLLTKAQVDAELAQMRNMTAEEAAAVAAKAVSEAEAAIKEAEEAAREAEAAEAEAEEAKAFAEAAMSTLKRRNASKLIVRA